MTLTTTLTTFYALSQAETAEEEALSALIPRGVTFPARTKAQEARQEAYLEGPRPAQERLIEFVDGLSPQELRAIAALMYSGRDGQDLALDDDRKPESLAQAILEKTPRVKYIQAGVSRYGASQIDDLVS